MAKNVTWWRPNDKRFSFPRADGGEFKCVGFFLAVLMHDGHGERWFVYGDDTQDECTKMLMALACKGDDISACVTGAMMSHGAIGITHVAVDGFTDIKDQDDKQLLPQWDQCYELLCRRFAAKMQEQDTKENGGKSLYDCDPPAGFEPAQAHHEVPTVLLQDGGATGTGVDGAEQAGARGDDRSEQRTEGSEVQLGRVRNPGRRDAQ